MNVETVLVTGAGGPAGVAVIRALQAAGHKVVAADADRLAVGLRLADDGAVVLRSDDPDFAANVAELAWATGATALIATVAEEIGALGGPAGQTVLARAGVRTWLPEPAPVAACIDKWRFAEVMAAAGVPAPATALGAAPTSAGPWIVKPRFGRGSRDVHVAETAGDLDRILPLVPRPIVQKMLGGREFTVDALVDREGRLAGAVPRWRLETKAGISTKGVTFADPDLVEAVGQVLAAVGMTGPANVQGFVSGRGQVAFVEVNPRFSGGLPLSLAAGCDLVGEYLRGIVGLPLRPDHLAFRPGVTMLRHFSEVFEG